MNILLFIVITYIPKSEAQLMDTTIYNPKKGLGISVNTDSTKLWLNKVKALKVSWYYRWGSQFPTGLPDSVDWTPMIYSYNGDSTSIIANIEYLDSLRQSGRVKALLGFNEPDNANESNMSVSQAIAAWPYMERLGVPLGSPATLKPDRTWMKNFMAQIDQLGYRVDFIAVHWYDAADPGKFISDIKNTYALYHRPIWITEFAVADYNATTKAQNRYSPAQVLNFMKQVLPVLDTLKYVIRYAWHSSPSASAAHWSSMLFDETGKITPLGEYYAQYEYGKQIPFAPVPVSPGSTIFSGIPMSGISQRPAIVWKASDYATGYQLQIATNSAIISDGSFQAQNLVVDTTISDTTLQLTTSLSANTIYYWHVCALDSAESSNYTGTYFFKTGTGTSAINQEEKEPIKFSLQQNYPNPFNPTTEISYSIPKSGYASLKVYNILGQEVEKLFEGLREAGIYKVSFNASRLTDGVYIYRLQANDRSITKKMIVLK